MQRIFHTLLVALITTGVFLPVHALAARGPASFALGSSLVAASSSPGNAYLAGISVVSTAPIAGDLSAVGGSIISAAPVAGDELFLAGSINLRAPVAGDVRAAGGNISVESPIAGDLAAFGYSVHDAARISGSTFIIAINATLLEGATGPVIIYGNTVALAGDFAGNVNVVATGHVSLAAGTIIRGKLVYEAPEAADIPASVTVLGGVEYTSASYLPDAGTSRILALVSIGFFLFARILGALILAGLLAGLFPRLAEAVVERAYLIRLRSLLLTMLLGFGILVASPVLILLLTLTFVGIGLALLLLILYALLILLALLYAGILLGSVAARRFLKRETVLWHDGILGMLAFSLIALIPFIGLFIVFLLTVFTAGALLQILFSFAFPHEEQIDELI